MIAAALLYSVALGGTLQPSECQAIGSFVIATSIALVSVEDPADIDPRAMQDHLQMVLDAEPAALKATGKNHMIRDAVSGYATAATDFFATAAPKPGDTPQSHDARLQQLVAKIEDARRRVDEQLLVHCQ